MKVKLFGMVGVLIWVATLPWVQLTWAYGAQDASVPGWAFAVVAATLAVMSVSVPAWLCSLCVPALVRWRRYMLPGVLFGAAFYGWISLSAVAQMGQAGDVKTMITLVSPLLMTLWLVVSVPLAWRQQTGISEGVPPKF